MPVDLFPLYLSLKVAGLATLASLIVGLAIAWVLAKYAFRGRDLLAALTTLPLVLPPTVLGYYLLVVLGANSPLGRFFESIGLPLVFTWQAAVIAASIVSLPLLIRSAQAGFEGVDPTLEDAARTLGRSELSIALSVTVPLAWRGILVGTALAFTRALGEFGTTLMIAGNIPGRTQTMPIAIYDAVQVGNMGLANTLVAITTIAAIVILLLLSRFGRSTGW